MHPHRPSFARPSVSREPIVDGDLNARAALITPAPRYVKPDPCNSFSVAFCGCVYDCESSFPDLTDLTPQGKAGLASCVCSDYAFDAHVSSCLKTIPHGPRSASILQYSDFCHHSHTPSPTTTQSRSARRSTRPPSTVTKLAACSTMCSVLTSCANESPGFMDMDRTTQASCLCYTSTKWVPDVWDSAVASCPTETAAASCMSTASALSEFQGLCHSVGTQTPPPTSAPDHAGEIAGGVLGGIAGVGLICGVGVILFKWMVGWQNELQQ